MNDPGIWPLLWGDDRSEHELVFSYDGRRGTTWVPCHERDRLVWLLSHTEDCKVSAVPRVRRDAYAWGDAHHLWVFLDKPNSCRRLQVFRPCPTFVWREGRSRRRWASWALARPLMPARVQRATERLAFSLGGLRRLAAPSALIDSPLSGRWTIEYHQPVDYDIHDIVGHLRDAPEPVDWRNRIGMAA